MDWNSYDRGVFLLNVLGIVHNPQTNKILIGKRQDDPLLPELTWCFPGGRPAYEQELEEYLLHEIKKKTNLEVDVDNIFFAKTYPENRQLLSIYYGCSTTNEAAVAGEKFIEVKWINPTEAKEYFTTSLHENIIKYLESLESNG